VGNKRFTDKSKWRNEWFRTLPLKAKLAWMYLCDECDNSGILKTDWGLATFQLGFTVDELIFREWFGDKVFFITNDQILIVQFFEFQYGQSKDSWSAKIEARKTLENLGFSIVNNKVYLGDLNKLESTVTPLCGDSVDTTLIRGRGRGRVKGRVSIKGECEGKNDLPELANLWNTHCGSLAKVIGTNKSRNKKITERLNEAPLEEWVTVIKKLAASSFCNGSTGWKADFDFLIQPETRLKALEGKYDDRVPQNKNQINQGYEHSESAEETRKALGL